MTYSSPTTINATRGIVSVLEYINEVTNFWISRLLMVALFIIFAVGYYRSKNDDDILGSFAIGSYACLVIGLPLWIIDFLDGVSFGFVIGICLISTAILLMDRRGTS